MENSAIVKIYASLVRNGIKNLSEVPDQIRDKVQKELEQAE